LPFHGCIPIDIFINLRDILSEAWMKKIPAILVLFFSPVLLHAQDGGTGIGMMLGEPAGIGFKTWISGRSAIDAGLGWSFYAGATQVHADYLWHNFMLFRMKEGTGKLPLYMGLGGRIRVSGKDAFVGVRVPIGLTYIFPGDRLDVFLEAVPVLNLIPGTGFDLNAGTGIRYFFIKNTQ
jgi:hypothetical protein